MKTNEEKALELARGLILHAYEGWINQRAWISQEYWLERYGQFHELLCEYCEPGSQPVEKKD